MSNNSIVPLPIEQIESSPLNTRKVWREEAQNELKESMHQHGLLQPIIVRRMDKDRYQVVIGSRRLSAAQALGWKKIEGRIRRLTNSEALRLILVENNQREDVHPLDEAAGFRSLMDLEEISIAGVAEVVSRSESYVVSRLKLLDLCPEAMASYLQGEMIFSIALRIAKLNESDQSVALDFWLNSSPSVKVFSKFIAEKVERNLATAPWDLTDKKLDPEAGACATCPKTSKSQATLFHDMEGDRCLDGTCFESKHAAWNERMHREHEGLINLGSMTLKGEGYYAFGEYTLAVEAIPPSACCQGVFIDGPRRGERATVCIHPDYTNVPVNRGDAAIEPSRVMKLAQGVKDDIQPHATIHDALMALAMKRCGVRKTKEILDGRDTDRMTTEDKGHLLLALLLVALHCPESVLMEIGRDYKVTF